MQDPSVVIVGAGPAGLTSALLLARYGVAVTLVERHPNTSVHPKARGLNVRTMEILRSLGLERQVQAAGQTLAKNKYMLFVETLAGREVRRIADDDLMMQGDALGVYTPCTWTQCAQDSLEALLAREAEAAGAKLKFHTELLSFDQDDSGVRCRMRDCDTGDEQNLHADYMLACDGANSRIRQALGIELEGRAAIERFTNIYFRADLKPYANGRWFGICFVENPEVQGLFLPVDNDTRWLFNVQSHAKPASSEKLTVEECQQLVRAAIGDSQLSVEIINALPWAASALVVSRLRERRVFLMGDAGHILPPAGGFGLNMAVQDAHNLAWKLAHVLQKKADPALLETYEQERLPLAKAIARYAEQEMEAPNPWEHGEPSADQHLSSEHAEGAEAGNPWDASLEQQLQAVIGFQYRSSAVSDGPALDGLNLHGQPGTRFPHAWLGVGHSTLDLLPPAYSVVTSTSYAGNLANAPYPVIELPSEVWTNLFSHAGSQALLVRPDGIIAGGFSM